MERKTFYPLYLLSNLDPTQFLVDYSTMLNIDFIQILLSAYPQSEHQRSVLNQYLDTGANVTFIRQFVHLINRLNYFTLQAEQWTYYYQLGLTEGIWSGHVSKRMGKLNSMPYTYGRRKGFIEKRQRYYQEQRQEITDRLQYHRQQAPLYMDTNQLVSMLKDFVKHDQYRLCVELQRRRYVLKFDAKDHQLVQEFYQLKPRLSEVCQTSSHLQDIHLIVVSVHLDSFRENNLESSS